MWIRALKKLGRSTSPDAPPGLRLVFFGTPEFAVPALRRLAADQTVALVVTQPDRPAGRGGALRPPPVAQEARALGLPVVQPRNPNRPAAREQIAGAQPDVAVVAAYGRLLGAELLALPPAGVLNAHPSLLPEFRGAAPIQAALLQGRRTTGVSIIKLDQGLDSGPLIAARSIDVDPTTTAPRLHDQLAGLAADLLAEVLPDWVAGAGRAQPQDPAVATVTRPLTRDDGAIDVRRPAREIYDRWRAFQPWPGVRLSAGEVDCKLVALGQPGSGALPPGRVWLDGEVIRLACGDGDLPIERLQPSGRHAMSASEFARGYGRLLEVAWGRPFPAATEAIVRPVEG